MKGIQDTSTKSFEQTTLSGDRETQKNRCLAFLRTTTATDGEAMRALGIKDVNNYRPRRTELYQEGRVQKVGKKYCAVSGRLCYIWKATETPKDVEEKLVQDALAHAQDYLKPVKIPEVKYENIKR